MTAAPVLDAHVHVWDLARRLQPWIPSDAREVLARDHSVDELQEQMRKAGVGGAVLVQVLNDAAETGDYLWAAAQSTGLLGVVGWVDLLAVDLDARLETLQSHPSGATLLGVRHQALAEPDPAGWLAGAGESGGLARLGQAGLVCDLMFRPEHLAEVYVVTRAHARTSFVLDHAGKPPITSGWASEESRAWATETARLAELPNVACKLSGLTTMADLVTWQVGDLTPYVEHLLAHFGPDRLLFGSDWPVSRRAGDYVRTVGTARELVARLSPDEQRAVLAGTAERVYALTSRLA